MNTPKTADRQERDAFHRMRRRYPFICENDAWFTLSILATFNADRYVKTGGASACYGHRIHYYVRHIK